MSRSNNVIASQPFGQIIGAPLRAAVEAQALAAKTTVDFIEAVGFKKKEVKKKKNDDFGFEDEEDTDEDTEVGEVRNIVFSYVREGDGEDEKCILTVPILAIVPIPYLRIERMSLDYSIRVDEQETTASQSSRNSQSSSSSRSSSSSSSKRTYSSRYRWWWSGWNRSNYRTSYSNNRNSSAASASSSASASAEQRASRFQQTTTMNINLIAVQDDLPSGISKVLDILDTVITEKRTVIEDDTNVLSPTPTKSAISEKATAA